MIFFLSFLVRIREMLGILDFLELFLILGVYYKITDDTEKIMGKTKFNKRLTSAH